MSKFLESIKKGIPIFIGTLQTMYIIFKITNIVEWSWTEVFIPLIIFACILATAILYDIFNDVFKI